MSVILINNIKQLAGVRPKSRLLRGKELSELPVINDAWLIVEDGQIASYGKMEDLKPGTFKQTIDATDQYILPAWCDSHTHIVFPSSREEEFVDKIKGMSY